MISSGVSEVEVPSDEPVVDEAITEVPSDEPVAEETVEEDKDSKTEDQDDSEKES